MTTDQDILTLAREHWPHGYGWYEQEAAYAVRQGRYRLIHGRTDQDVYLLRCWLNTPALDSDGDFDSGNSTLLHYFPRGDDDACLHDHPWDFRTTLLNGYYFEHLPPLSWMPGSELGPVWDVNVIQRWAGQTMEHAAEDLHCVGAVGDETWTLMRTGPRRRPWGFHPPGKLWQPWKQYIAGLSEQGKCAACDGSGYIENAEDDNRDDEDVCSGCGGTGRMK